MTEQLVLAVNAIAEEAAQAIMEVYDSDFSVERKSDNSPLTEADLAAHNIIVSRLNQLTPAIPVLSEESADIPFATRQGWSKYWLVDPLDGTKEFVNRNGEFTVNIALVDQHRPVLGVVWIPATGTTYYAEEGFGAFRQASSEPPVPIETRRPLPDTEITVAGSRSHSNEETQAFINRIAADFGDTEVRSMGSSLKFCLVAEGGVDVYPRFGPTSEWDTAAAHALVEVAGGRVLGLDLQPLRYNQKDSLLNPHFLVVADPEHNWAKYLE